VKHNKKVKKMSFLLTRLIFYLPEKLYGKIKDAYKYKKKKRLTKKSGVLKNPVVREFFRTTIRRQQAEILVTFNPVTREEVIESATNTMITELTPAVYTIVDWFFKNCTPLSGEYLIGMDTEHEKNSWFFLTNYRIIQRGRKNKHYQVIPFDRTKSYRTKGWWTASLFFYMADGTTVTFKKVPICAKEKVINQLIHKKEWLRYGVQVSSGHSPQKPSPCQEKTLQASPILTSISPKEELQEEVPANKNFQDDDYSSKGTIGLLLFTLGIVIMVPTFWLINTSSTSKYSTVSEYLDHNQMLVLISCFGCFLWITGLCVLLFSGMKMRRKSSSNMKSQYSSSVKTIPMTNGKKRSSHHIATYQDQQLNRMSTTSHTTPTSAMDTKYCPLCRKNIPSSWRVCGFCGTEYTCSFQADYSNESSSSSPQQLHSTFSPKPGKPAFCPQCGAKIDSAWVKCAFCGYRISELLKDIRTTTQKPSQQSVSQEHLNLLPKKTVEECVKEAFKNINSKQYQKAKKCLEEALSENQKNAKLWSLKGVVLQKLGEFSSSLACFDRSLFIDPNNLETWKSKATSFVRLERYLEAIPVLDRIIGKKSDEMSLLMRGQCSFGLNKFQEALSFWDKILLMSPNSKSANQMRGITLAKLERYEDALPFLEKALLKGHSSDVADLITLCNQKKGGLRDKSIRKS